MEPQEMKLIIESLIFTSHEPLSIGQITEILEGSDRKVIKSLIWELIEEYAAPGRSFHLVEVAEGYQFRTKPVFKPWVKKVRSRKPLRFSQAAMETLAIIAYKQPVVRSEVEFIRGVDSGSAIKSLLEKGLIRILGRKAVPGRPILYGTSKKFLEVFSLKDLKGLPNIREFEELEGSDDS